MDTKDLTKPEKAQMDPSQGGTKDRPSSPGASISMLSNSDQVSSTPCTQLTIDILATGQLMPPDDSTGESKTLNSAKSGGDAGSKVLCDSSKTDGAQEFPRSSTKVANEKRENLTETANIAETSKQLSPQSTDIEKQISEFFGGCNTASACTTGSEAKPESPRSITELVILNAESVKPDEALEHSDTAEMQTEENIEYHLGMQPMESHSLDRRIMADVSASSHDTSTRQPFETEIANSLHLSSNEDGDLIETATGNSVVSIPTDVSLCAQLTLADTAAAVVMLTILADDTTDSAQLGAIDTTAAVRLNQCDDTSRKFDEGHTMDLNSNINYIPELGDSFKPDQSPKYEQSPKSGCSFESNEDMNQENTAKPDDSLAKINTSPKPEQGSKPESSPKSGCSSTENHCPKPDHNQYPADCSSNPEEDLKSNNTFDENQKMAEPKPQTLETMPQPKESQEEGSVEDPALVLSENSSPQASVLTDSAEILHVVTAEILKCPSHHTVNAEAPADDGSSLRDVGIETYEEVTVTQVHPLHEEEDDGIGCALDALQHCIDNVLALEGFEHDERSGYKKVVEPEMMPIIGSTQSREITDINIAQEAGAAISGQETDFDSMASVHESKVVYNEAIFDTDTELVLQVTTAHNDALLQPLESNDASSAQNRDDVTLLPLEAIKQDRPAISSVSMMENVVTMCGQPIEISNKTVVASESDQLNAASIPTALCHSRNVLVYDRVLCASAETSENQQALNNLIHESENVEVPRFSSERHEMPISSKIIQQEAQLDTESQDELLRQSLDVKNQLHSASLFDSVAMAVDTMEEPSSYPSESQLIDAESLVLNICSSPRSSVPMNSKQPSSDLMHEDSSSFYEQKTDRSISDPAGLIPSCSDQPSSDTASLVMSSSEQRSPNSARSILLGSDQTISIPAETEIFFKGMMSSEQPHCSLYIPRKDTTSKPLSSALCLGGSDSLVTSQPSVELASSSYSSDSISIGMNSIPSQLSQVFKMLHDGAKGRLSVVAFDPVVRNIDDPSEVSALKFCELCEPSEGTVSEVSSEPMDEACCGTIDESSVRAMGEASYGIIDEASGGEMCEASGVTMGKTSGVTMGETSGVTLGETSGVTMGETSGVTMGKTSDEVMGETSGVTMGETSGVTMGETSGEVIGEASRETMGETSGEVMGETSCETLGNVSGKTMSIAFNEAICEVSGGRMDEASGETMGKVAGGTIVKASYKTISEASGEKIGEAFNETTGKVSSKTENKTSVDPKEHTEHMDRALREFDSPSISYVNRIQTELNEYLTRVTGVSTKQFQKRILDPAIVSEIPEDAKKGGIIECSSGTLTSIDSVTQAQASIQANDCAEIAVQQIATIHLAAIVGLQVAVGLSDLAIETADQQVAACESALIDGQQLTAIDTTPETADQQHNAENDSAGIAEQQIAANGIAHAETAEQQKAASDSLEIRTATEALPVQEIDNTASGEVHIVETDLAVTTLDKSACKDVQALKEQPTATFESEENHCTSSIEQLETETSNYVATQSAEIDSVESFQISDTAIAVSAPLIACADDSLHTAMIVCTAEVLSTETNSANNQISPIENDEIQATAADASSSVQPKTDDGNLTERAKITEFQQGTETEVKASAEIVAFDAIIHSNQFSDSPLKEAYIEPSEMPDEQKSTSTKSDGSKKSDEPSKAKETTITEEEETSNSEPGFPVKHDSRILKPETKKESADTQNSVCSCHVQGDTSRAHHHHHHGDWTHSTGPGDSGHLDWCAQSVRTRIELMEACIHCSGSFGFDSIPAGHCHSHHIDHHSDHTRDTKEAAMGLNCSNDQCDSRNYMDDKKRVSRLDRSYHADSNEGTFGRNCSRHEDIVAESKELAMKWNQGDHRAASIGLVGLEIGPQNANLQTEPKSSTHSLVERLGQALGVESSFHSPRETSSTVTSWLNPQQQQQQHSWGPLRQHEITIWLRSLDMNQSISDSELLMRTLCILVPAWLTVGFLGLVLEACSVGYSLLSLLLLSAILTLILSFLLNL